MSKYQEASNMLCLKCRERLVDAKTEFDYLGYRFTAELPRCPKCGQLYISEELVNGKIKEVEMSLEDK